MKRASDPITCLTVYDASFATHLQTAGIDVLLIGDSLGMVIQGHDTTLPVRLSDMIYHGQCVARAGGPALRIIDMPFMSYVTPAQAADSAARLVQEGGAHMVKLEGGSGQCEIVRALTAQGIPVCAHLGLQPQSIHLLGGYTLQGRNADDAQALYDDALAVQQAGARLLILECVPSALAQSITQSLGIPVIGIGAGPHCDGQVLVLYDMLGITPGRPPRFTRDFLAQTASVPQALKLFIQAVKERTFPGPEHYLA